MDVMQWPYPSLEFPYQGIDFAGMGTITPQLAADMVADGISFVGRYLYSSQYPNGKGISAEEARIYLAAGLAIFLYYEVNTSDALGGYPAGRSNGRAAAQLAAQLNVPQGTPIICCCDTSVTVTEAFGVVMQYLEGFASELPDYSTGIYGGTFVMQAAAQTWPNALRVQAGAWGATEYEDLFVRQWYIPRNDDAVNGGWLRIRNVTLDQNNYASWRGHSVDLCSAPDLRLMWGGHAEKPKMPIWFYLKKRIQ